MNLLFKIQDNPVPDIKGLSYFPDFISQEEERLLISLIDGQAWLSDLKRRVQHYGYKYDYKARAVTKDSYLGPLPSWLQSVADKLQEKKIFSSAPDQVIVNEYLPGQGISAHIDCVPCFGNTIASLSLSTDAVMQFTHPHSGIKSEIVLSRCSLVVLSDEARYKWMHSIPARKTDIIGGCKAERGRRLSLTFRNVLLGTP